MKIAISTDGKFVSPHFGRCASFTLAEIEGGQVSTIEEIENPVHHPGFLPQFLSEKGVKCIVCGGMGQRAQALFRDEGINTVIGVAGSVEEAVRKFARGELEQGEDMCVPGSGKKRADEECHHKDENKEDQ